MSARGAKSVPSRASRSRYALLCGGSGRQQIAVCEATLAAHDLPLLNRDRTPEDRSVVHEGVELAVLAAWVGRRGQFAEQRAIVRAAGEAGVELRLVHADERCPEAGGDERLRQRARRLSPQRIQTTEYSLGEQAVPIVAHVPQVEIPEGDAAHRRVALSEFGERFEESTLVCRIRRLRFEG